MSARVRVSALHHCGVRATTLLRRAGAVLAAAALTVVGAIMLAPDDALAAGSPATGSNVTVTCSGATFNQGPGINTGYGDSTQNGLTVNVQSGASVTGTSTGIDVNNNNTINNLGTITTQGSGGVGDVYGINGNGPLTVNNSGSIGRADAVNNIFDLAGINALGGLTLTNQAGGVIQGGLGIQGGGTGTIVNFGLITAVGGGGDGINYVANPSTLTVTNNLGGTITGDASGIRANVATIFNSGTISSTPGLGGTGILVNNLTLTNYASGVISGDAGGVSGNQTPTLNVTNFGTITGGAQSAGTGAIGGNTVNVTNFGTLTTLAGSGAAAINTNSGTIINNAGGVISGDGGGIAAFNNTSVFNAGTINGNGGAAIFFTSVGGGGGGNTLTLGPGSVINGAVTGSGADTFQLGGVGTGTFDLSTLGAQYAGFSIFNKIGARTWIVTNTQSVTTPWTIFSGSLIVNGSLANATSVTVSGGTLGGTGTVSTTNVNAGGTLAPGNPTNPTGTLNIAGSLTFASASAFYLVNVVGASASKTNVTGTATVAGNVQVASTNPKAGTYDNLHSAGLGGTTFAGATSLTPNFAVSLGYTATDVFLTVKAQLGGNGLNPNQQGLSGVLSGAVNGGTTLPPALSNLFGLTGPALTNALSQLNGEAATGAEQSAFQLMNEFLVLMLDPFVDGRFGVAPGGAGAIGFAPDQEAALPPDISLAYASILNKAPAK